MDVPQPPDLTTGERGVWWFPLVSFVSKEAMSIHTRDFESLAWITTKNTMAGSDGNLVQFSEE